MSAALDSLVNGGLNVSQVVERIEYTDDVDAVFNTLSDEKANDIVGIMLVAQKVLTSEEHLQLGVRARLADLAQALPRIFVEISQAGDERSAAPALERIVARLVKLGQYCLEILIMALTFTSPSFLIEALSILICFLKSLRLVNSSLFNSSA